MSLKARSRRAFSADTSLRTPQIDVLSLSRGSKTAAAALPDGEHDILIHSAVHRVTKSGAVVILIDAVTLDDETPVKLRPLLIQSAGGDSDLTIRNFELLELLAGVEASSDLRTILEALINRQCVVDLGVTVDNRNGQDLNELLDVIESREAD